MTRRLEAVAWMGRWRAREAAGAPLGRRGRPTKLPMRALAGAGEAG